MRLEDLPIIESQALPPRLHLIRVRAPDFVARFEPGQFVMARGDYCHDSLRVPLFPTRLAGDEVSFVFQPSARLAALSRLPPVLPLSVIGPLGRPFRLDSRTRNLLVVGEDDSALLLLPLADSALLRGVSVSVVSWSALTRRALLPAEWIPPDAEYVGLVGADALSSHLSASLAWAEQVCAAGTPSLYCLLRTAVDQMPSRRSLRFVQAMRLSDFSCGMGLCGRCGSAAARPGPSCQSGPVFDLKDLT